MGGPNSYIQYSLNIFANIVNFLSQSVIFTDLITGLILIASTKQFKRECMSIGIQSRKAKGRSGQNFMRDLFRKVGLVFGLENGDIESRPMGCSGTDLIFSPSAKKVIPFDIEVKVQEKLALWDAWKQCVTNTDDGRISLLCVKRNGTDMLCVIKADDLMNLLYKNYI